MDDKTKRALWLLNELVNGDWQGTLLELTHPTSTEHGELWGILWNAFYADEGTIDTLYTVDVLNKPEGGE